jgi:hypothetical protein
MLADLDQVEPAVHAAMVERAQVSPHHQDQVTAG